MTQGWQRTIVAGALLLLCLAAVVIGRAAWVRLTSRPLAPVKAVSGPLDLPAGERSAAVSRSGAAESRIVKSAEPAVSDWLTATDSREQARRIQADEVLRQIPVLMYHEIGDVSNNNYVRLSEFVAQMRWLAENGYQTVTLEAVYRHINDFRPLPPRPVVLTFDDGYRSFYTEAVPVLRQYGFRATAFLIPGMIEHPEHMTWQQVKELPALGMEIGSHTLTHPDLRYLKGERLKRELVESKRVLEERSGVPVSFFCYPAGKHNEETAEVVKASGYLGAVTTAYGPVRPEQTPFLWSRIRILRGESTAGFAKKVKDASGGR